MPAPAKVVTKFKIQQYSSSNSANTNQNQKPPKANQHSGSISSRYPQNYFLPSVPESNSNTATQIRPPVTTRQISQSVLRPSVIQNHTEEPPFLPVTPTWLQPTTSKSHLKSYPNHSIRGGHSNLRSEYRSSSIGTNNNFWEKIPNPRPILSHIQQPLLKRRPHHRPPSRPQNVVVRHGIYPLIKSRRRLPKRFF